MANGGHKKTVWELCNVPNMHWNAIQVFTYPLDCLSYAFWVRGDLSAIWAGSALGFFYFKRKITRSAPSPHHSQITCKSPKRHKKDTQAGKWTLLLHFSAYSGHCIISHTFFLCPPLTINFAGYLWSRHFLWRPRTPGRQLHHPPPPPSPTPLHPNLPLLPTQCFCDSAARIWAAWSSVELTTFRKQLET